MTDLTGEAWWRRALYRLARWGIQVLGVRLAEAEAPGLVHDVPEVGWYSNYVSRAACGLCLKHRDIPEELTRRWANPLRGARAYWTRRRATCLLCIAHGARQEEASR